MKPKKLIPFLFASILLLANCKPEELVRVTKLQTGTITDKSSSTAKASATFIDVSNNVSGYGHCWGISSNPLITDGKSVVSGIAQRGDYTSDLIGLTAKTKYYVRAYAQENDKVVYGNEIPFTTLEVKTIGIASPALNEIWIAGTLDTIRWTDNIEENVKIELYKGGTKQPDIVTSTESDGIYEWSPDINLSTGENYSIKIISVNDINISGTSSNFTIKEAPYITISQPTAGVNWIKESTNEITWTDNIDDNVNIELYKTGILINDIISNTPSDQSYNWKIPRELSTGSDYTIKIISKTNSSLYSASGQFTIKETLPTLSTLDITSITKTSATSGGNISSDGGANITARGICWGTATNPTIALSTKTNDGPGTGSFTSSITGLSPGTIYYVRAYATNAAGTAYGAELSFTTTSASVPTLTTTTVISAITQTTASSGGNISSDGGASITARGVCWNTSTNPTISLSTKTDDASGTGSFISSIINLTADTKYYVRAYATNSAGTAYGNEISFTTGAILTPPTAGGASATLISNTTATLNGAVNANGKSSTVIFEYGTTNLYGSVINATPANVTGVTATNVIAALISLTPGTVYHYRIKAESVDGISYSDDLTFTTLQVPSATTEAATLIDYNSARLNGKVNASNLPTTVTFEYGTTNTYGLSVPATPGTVTGMNLTNVSVNLQDLLPNTTYHFRTVAVSAGGTAYGLDKEFKTDCQKPDATTNAATSITNSSATLNGLVNANSFSTTITFEYGTTTSYGSIVTAAQSPLTGNTSSTVSASLTGLNPGTTYHFRVKTNNCGGTNYGDDKTFTTTCPAPTATTGTGYGSAGKAYLKGTVNANGCATNVSFEYTAGGVASTINATPRSVSGNTDTNVNATVIDLLPGASVSFRVKAVSAGGTVYGITKSFTIGIK